MSSFQKSSLYAIAAAMAVISTSTMLSVSASSEDDGYTYPDYASEEEKEEIDEQEQEAWEDAGRPGDDNNDDNDDNDDDNNDNDDNDDNPLPSQQTVIPASQNCDTWSYDSDIKLAGLNATSQLLDRMYIDAETNVEMDKYNAEVDKYNAKVAVVGTEVDRFNAECAT
jgi:hypothetical protein